MLIPSEKSRVVHCRSAITPDLLLQCRLGAGEGGSLLELLSARFPYHTISRWRELIDLGQVTVNGRVGVPGQQLAVGDRLAYLTEGFSEPEVPTCFEPVMESTELRLVGKPAGLPVTRTGLIVRNTLVNLLRQHYGEEIHLLHRLDRETSGLVLCSRSREACRRLQDPRLPLISGKYYLAVVRGRMPPGFRQVDQPLATRPDSEIRCRMWPEAEGKACRTIFHPLATATATTLVLAELVTGRRHQIRAHLAHLGYPVIGDKIYGHEGRYFLKRVAGELSAADYQELGATNHTLHAWALRLKIADGPERLFYSRIFSEDMECYLNLFPGWEERARRKLEKILNDSVNR